MKKFLKYSIPILWATFLIFLFSYGIYHFFSTQGVDGQELINKSTSPDGKYTVSAYLNNGGATTAWAVLCSVENNETGRERNIYWNYNCSEAEIIWIDNDTVTINDIELDLPYDTYDFRYDE